MNIENIILNGCSFVHGFDLCFEQFGIEPYTNFDLAYKNFTQEQMDIFEQSRLSGKLTKLLDCRVTNLAQIGETNQGIARSTMEYIEKYEPNPENTIVLIGWTDYTRDSFFMPELIQKFSLANISNYIEWHKKSKGPKKLMDLYEQMLPIENLINTHRCFINKYYYEHLNLITLLQLYLEKKSLKYLMWNSLSTWPIDVDYPYNYNNYESMINWSAWWPDSNKESYDIAWGDEVFRGNPETKSKVFTQDYNRTVSGHPSIPSVEKFSQDLYKFIRKNY